MNVHNNTSTKNVLYIRCKKHTKAIKRIAWTNSVSKLSCDKNSLSMSLDMNKGYSSNTNRLSCTLNNI